MCCNQKGNISTLNGSSLKLSGQVHVLWLGHLIYWKWHQYAPSKSIGLRSISYQSYGSPASDKIKCNFFQAVVASILLHLIHHMDDDETYGEKSRWE